MTFQGESGVAPDLATILEDAKLEDPWALVTTIPGSLKPILKIKETGILETELRVHRIHDTLETGLHEDASQPGGSHKGGRRIS